MPPPARIGLTKQNKQKKAFSCNWGKNIYDEKFFSFSKNKLNRVDTKTDTQADFATYSLKRTWTYFSENDTVTVACLEVLAWEPLWNFT